MLSTLKYMHCHLLTWLWGQAPTDGHGLVTTRRAKVCNNLLCSLRRSPSLPSQVIRKTSLVIAPLSWDTERAQGSTLSPQRSPVGRCSLSCKVVGACSVPRTTTHWWLAIKLQDEGLICLLQIPVGLHHIMITLFEIKIEHPQHYKTKQWTSDYK